MNEVVNATARGKEKAATTKRSRGRQTASHTLINANQPPSHTRRKVAEIRRDVREATRDPGVPPPQRIDRFECTRGDHDAEIQVVRTEACSPALSALVMATAGYGQSNWMSEGCRVSQQPPQDHQNSAPSSVHQAPQLLYPAPSSVFMTLPLQDQPVTNAQVQMTEGLSSHCTRSTSHVPYLLYPQHQCPRPYPLPSTSSMHSTSLHSSIPTRPMSWTQYPLASFAGQAASSSALSGPGPPIQVLQLPNQGEDAMDYPHPNRM